MRVAARSSRSGTIASLIAIDKGDVNQWCLSKFNRLVNVYTISVQCEYTNIHFAADLVFAALNFCKGNTTHDTRC